MLYRAADRLRQRAVSRRITGGIGEDLAHRFLRAQGCTVVARNYRTLSGSGEIDLVAWDGERLAFVEVKTRATESSVAPEVAVDAEKRERVEWLPAITRGAPDVAWKVTRFDIVSIVLERPPRIEWLRDAF